MIRVLVAAGVVVSLSALFVGFRSGGNRADQVCGTSHTFLGDFPEERGAFWADNLQGVTHDERNWFFSQAGRLWKIPVTFNLGLKVRDQAEAIASKEIINVRLPDVLPDRLKEYNKFGHLDRFGDFLFVALSHQPTTPSLPPRFAVFSTRDLRYLSSVALQQRAAGWVARRPRSSLIYTSDGDITPQSPILGYRIDVKQLRRTSALIVTRDEAFKIFLRDEQGRALTLPHMQGAVWSNENCLYVVNGFCTACDGNPLNGGATPHSVSGIHVFRVDGRIGIRVAKSSHQRGPFLYRFKPGNPANEEPEGLTFWPVDSLEPPGIRGELHVILLDNEKAQSDQYYLKHYRVR